MHLHCPNCTRQIEQDGINLVKTIAICKTCDNIFDFTRQMNEAQLPVPYRRVTHVPKNVHLTEYTDGLEISLRWRDLGTYCQAGFGLFWTGFVAVWTMMALYGTIKGGAPIIFPLFSIPFWAVGIGLLYNSVAKIFTTTVISVDTDFLAIEHRPLRPIGMKNQYYRPEEVQQLYVKKKVTKNKNGSTTTYRVYAQLTNGKDIILVEQLNDENTARYVEQRIEQYLDIPNRPVAGEHRSVRA